MRRLLFFFSLILLVACKGSSGAQPCPVKEDQLLAFPGAQGFGSSARGGRGGSIIEVTNLNDSGKGSFRQACLTPGRRIVVFKTGGHIKLKSSIRIEDPFITIAGQTAPGDGITISGASLIISAGETIIRGLRIRIGSDKVGDYDGIAILSKREDPVQNVIIDHCTISWSIDENISTNGRKSWISKVTFSNNIISEGLNDSRKHSKGMPHSAGMLLNKSGVDSVSVIGNLFAHNKFRQPKVGTGVSAEIINNVMYNWATKCTTIAPKTRVNIIGNYYKPGPDWNHRYNGILLGEDGDPDDTGEVYIMDNLGPGRESDQSDQWEVTSGSRHWRSATPVLKTRTKIVPASTAYYQVLDRSGAWPRDSHDHRVVNEVKNGTGKILLSESSVGGLSKFDTGSSPTDSDNDGIPDYFELSIGLDPKSSDNIQADHNCNGYPDIEDYINSFFMDLY